MAHLSKAQMAFVTNNYSAPAAGNDKRKKELSEKEEDRSWVYHDWTQFGMTDTYDPAKEQQKFKLMQLREQLSQGVSKHEQHISKMDMHRDKIIMGRDQVKMKKDMEQWQLSSFEDKQSSTDQALTKIKHKLRNPNIKGDRRWDLESRRSRMQDQLYRINDSLFKKRDQINNMEEQISKADRHIDEIDRKIESSRNEFYRLKERLAKVEQQLSNMGFA